MQAAGLLVLYLDYVQDTEIKRAGKNYDSKRRGRLNFPFFLLGDISYG